MKYFHLTIALSALSLLYFLLPNNEELYKVESINKLFDKSSSFSRENKIVHLSEFTEKYSKDNQIFLLETSGKSFLSGRECCAVESAARNSGLYVQFLLLSSVLNLKLSNCTYQIFHNYPNVSFWTFTLPTVFAG